ncbi:hypothetical protein EX30DRAFT_162403 [Ascodesmis nigricans]|uniref:Uncharacterized protein n=1 Tax=Ascodesmis nigricans TaxID=341454 RepID=A0A4S2MMK2_9PEZI|nr:hypothetical protein EX30DRAFT_162403 [Ascodesmis nigricans]
MSSTASSSARGGKIPISDRARRKSSTSPSSKRKTPSAASTIHRRTTSTENNSTPVSSALGEGSPASGRVYARPQPPGRTPRKTPTRGMNPPPRNMSTPTRTRGEVSAFLTPEPEDDMLRREDGTRYASRGEALFERVWKKYDPNDLGSPRISSTFSLELKWKATSPETP